MANKFQCFVLTKMSSKDVIMIILENTCMKIASRQYIDFVIKKKKTVRVHRSLVVCENVFCSNWITRKSQKDVSVQNVQINNYSCTKKRKEKDSSLYRGHKLFLSKDWFKFVRVDCSIASILPFRINIPLFNESIQFGTKMTRTKPNNKVELREVFGLLYLFPDQHLGSRKVLKVFMVHNNINGISQILQIVSLNFESFKNSK